MYLPTSIVYTLNFFFQERLSIPVILFFVLCVFFYALSILIMRIICSSLKLSHTTRLIMDHDRRK